MQKEIEKIIQKIQTSNESSLVYDLKRVIKKYPYFSTARLLYLRELKQNKSLRYNLELKKSSIHVPNRSILFDFVHAPKELQPNKKEDNQKTKVENHEKLKVKSTKPKEKKNRTKKTTPKKETIILDIHKKYPFSTWMELSKPTQTVTNTKKNNPKKTGNRKLEIIDKFIDNHVKLKPKRDGSEYLCKDITMGNITQDEDLMTDTLAQIYIEQRKYAKAIKAYQILSMKYPEKKSIFTNKIEYIRKIQFEK